MSTAAAKSVAFLGTGLMGAPMAARLLASGQLTAVWNRTVASTVALAQRGAHVAMSITETLGPGVSVVCLCLTDGNAVDEVIFGPGGVVESAKTRKTPLVIDFSTSSPQETKSFAGRYHAKSGGMWLDAPVSGGVGRAQNGQLIVYCGGAPADFAIARPVFDTVASRATLLGPVGAGQAAKLIAQLISAPTLVAMAEALAVADAMGLDRMQLVETFSGGLVDSPLLQIFGRRMASGQTEPRIGAVATMRKDIENAVRMAADVQSPTRVAGAAATLLNAVCENGNGSQELTTLTHHFMQERSQRRGN